MKLEGIYIILKFTAIMIIESCPFILMNKDVIIVFNELYLEIANFGDADCIHFITNLKGI